MTKEKKEMGEEKSGSFKAFLDERKLIKCAGKLSFELKGSCVEAEKLEWMTTKLA